MSTEYEKLLELTECDEPKLTAEFRALLHKELALGMTRFVCRHGTLSEGFDKVTPSQKYYQAVKEAYGRSNELRRIRANAKKAQADLIDAQEELNFADTEAKQLRAEAAVELAQLSLFELLVTAEDTARQLDEFNKIRLELQDQVRAQYPEGIEQAEPDNWKVVAELRSLKAQSLGTREDLTVIPLPSAEKAKFGLQIGHPEMAVSYTLENKEEISSLYQGNVQRFLEKKTGFNLQGLERKT